MKKTTAKDTFWNTLKKEKGVTLKDISKTLDLDQATLSHYFTGMQLPSTTWSVKICDYFGIDYVTGAEEFNKAHAAWVAENPGNKKKRSHIRSRKYDFDNISEEYDFTANVPNTTVAANIGECLPQRERLLRFLYSKVDYDIYNEVMNILNS